MSISERIRPNSEAAPWVIEEVRKLEAEVERLRHELQCSDETIDMLYEKSRRYAEQVDKYEAEAKRLQIEVDRLKKMVEVG